MVPPPATDFRLREWRVSPRLNRLLRGAEAKHLEPKAMDLLVCLAREPGRVVSKQQIIDSVWEGRILADSAVTRVVADLRRALEDDAHAPRFIETIPKRGYRLIAEVRGAEPDIAAGDGRKRIAVLPFLSLGSPDDAGFAVGVTEEITTRLASVGALAVISSQSVRSCVASGMTTRQIADELSVHYILEGSVRWDLRGDRERLRISPQLIRADDDTHVWADSYDGDLRDVFAIQIEIAQRVLDHLDVVLRGRERSVILASRTDNIDAYRSYLRGLSHTLRADFWSGESMRVMVRAFERAVELDPSFAAAHAALAAVLAAGFLIGLDRSSECLPRARAALDRALRLEPDLPLARFALGLDHAASRQYDRAVEALEEALLGLPNDTELLRVLGLVHRYRGNWAESVRHSARALDLDPRDPRLATSLGYTYTLLRRYAEADSLYRRSLQIQPDQMSAYVVKTLNHWLADDPKGAQTTLEAMPAADHPSALLLRWQRELIARDFRAALDRLEASPLETIEDYLHWIPKPLLVGTTLRLAGEAASEPLESARGQLDRQLAGQPDDPRAHASLGLALASLGERPAAIRHGLRAVELSPLSDDAVAGAIQLENLAAVYVLTGDLDAAIEQLALLLSVPAPMSMALLELDPRWDALRDHPGYRRLAAESCAAVPELLPT